MHLAHLHLPRPIPYTHSLLLQETILERHFAYNTAARLQPKTSSQEPQSSRRPQPTLLTFQTHPTYTVGRRHLKSDPLSSAQIEFLTSEDLATFHASPRGGLLTYHAPGQLTGYLIYNLRAHGITPRCHVRLLEQSVIRTCKRFGVQGATTEDPGVWVVRPADDEVQDKNVAGQTSDRKICAIGVHVSRGITSHGIGLNCFDAPIVGPWKGRYKFSDVRENDREGVSAGKDQKGVKQGGQQADGYLSWGFSRIVACGLEGKSVTWLSRERRNGKQKEEIRLAEVASALAEEVCIGLSTMGSVKVDGIDQLEERDIMVDNDHTLKAELRDDVEAKQGIDMKGGLEDWTNMLKGGKM